MNISKIVELIMSLLTFHTTASKNNSKRAPSPSLGDSNDRSKKSELSGTSDSPTLQEKDGYFVWQKGQVFKLSDHFSTKEMDCQCSYSDCKEQRISKDLIQRLENIRVDVNQPLIITSAYRCSAHQEDIRKSGQSTVVAKKSTHELGDAVDARPKDKNMSGFEDICSKYFKSIGLSNSFLHLDTRSDVIRRWKY